MSSLQWQMLGRTSFKMGLEERNLQDWKDNAGMAYLIGVTLKYTMSTGVGVICAKCVKYSSASRSVDVIVSVYSIAMP